MNEEQMYTMLQQLVNMIEMAERCGAKLVETEEEKKALEDANDWLNRH